MLSRLGRVLKGIGRATYRQSARGAAGLVCLCAMLSVYGAAQASVPMYHNNRERTGANVLETTLTLSNVNSTQFGKLFTQPVDGFIYAQPLYVPNVNVAGLGIHNVVYVATMNDSVYAFDADNNTGSNALPLWQVSFINPPAGISPIISSDVACTGLISTRIGIVGTPVIDTVGGTLFVVARTREFGQYLPASACPRYHQRRGEIRRTGADPGVRGRHWNGFGRRSHEVSMPRVKTREPPSCCRMGWSISRGVPTATMAPTMVGSWRMTTGL